MTETHQTPSKNPKRISPHSATELLLEWEDGESYAVPYAEVRFQCPCAFCVDEMSGQRKIERSSITPGVKPLKVEIVGRYAVKFHWTDRHSSGMYPFDTLYEICKESGLPISPGG